MRKLIILSALLIVLAACGPSAPAGPGIVVRDAWAPPATATSGETGPGMGGTGAVFMTLANEGRESDRLLGAQTDVAEAVEIHRTVMKGEVMQMERVPSVEVPAGSRVKFEPGGYHLMLLGLRRDLQVGNRFQVTLTFERSGTVTVEVEVRMP